MAHFEIDRQTIADLGLFGDDSSAVYSFFNHTKTIGGAWKLRELMETPSYDLSILKSRKETIQYFHDNPIPFPVNKKDLDFIEHYLTHNKTPLKPNMLDAVAGKVKGYFSTDGELYIIQQGVNDLHKLLKVLTEFHELLKLQPGNTEVSSIAFELGNFLGKQEVRDLLSGNPDTELSFLKLSYYDNFFRKTDLVAIKNLLKIIYELDAYTAIAKAVEKHGFCFADYVDSDSCLIKISGLRHPAIKNAMANDVLIDPEHNLIFLTGANMAGKSSFLKALGLAVYLAHVGFPVPAKAMEISVFKGVITTINLSDNITGGYSHYFNEVNRLRETALKISKQDKLFVIFDELFRGTNVKDAYDASLATIAALSKIKNAVFLVSTHIVEIATELKTFDNIAFKYFDSGITDGKPVFDYKLKDGVSSETLGYFIFEREGIVAILEEAAKNANAK